MAGGNDEQPGARRKPVANAVAKVIDHPRTALAVGIVGVALTLATFELSKRTTSTPHHRSTGTVGTLALGHKLPPLDLNRGPSCRDLEQPAAAPSAGRTSFADSPGNVDGGQPGLEGVLLPNGKYGTVVEAQPGSEIEASAKLHNSAYSSASEVTLTVHVSSYHGTCWRLVGVANSQTNASAVSLGPFLIRLIGASGATLEYIRGSTTLFRGDGHVLIPRLADNVTNGGVTLPVDIPGGTTYFVNFHLRIRPL
jgi:hypothetical protein